MSTSPVIIPVSSDSAARSLEADLFVSDQHGLEQENISATGNLNIGVVLDYDAHAQRHQQGGTVQDEVQPEESPKLNREDAVTQAEPHSSDAIYHYAGDNSNSMQTMSFAQPGFSAIHSAPVNGQQPLSPAQTAEFLSQQTPLAPLAASDGSDAQTTVINTGGGGDGSGDTITMNNNNTYNTNYNVHFQQNNTQNNYYNTTNNGGDITIDTPDVDMTFPDITIDINLPDILGGNDAGENLITNVTNTVTHTVTHATDTVENIVNNVLGSDLQSTVVNTIGDVTGDTVNLAVDIVGDTLNTVNNVVGDVLGDTINITQDILGDTLNTVNNLLSQTGLLEQILNTASTTLDQATVILDGLLPGDPLQPLLDLLNLNGNLIDLDLAGLNTGLLDTGGDGSLLDVNLDLLSDLTGGDLTGILDGSLLLNASELPLLGEVGLDIPVIDIAIPDALDETLGGLLGALSEGNPGNIIEQAVETVTDTVDSITGALDDVINTLPLDGITDALPLDVLGALVDVDLGLGATTLLDTGENGSLIDLNAQLLTNPEDGLAGIINGVAFINTNELPMIDGLAETLELPDILIETNTIIEDVQATLPLELSGMEIPNLGDADALTDSLLELTEMAPLPVGGIGDIGESLLSGSDLLGGLGGADAGAASAPIPILPPVVVPTLPPLLGGFGGGLFGN